jgi:uncharacterized membrane protein
VAFTDENGAIVVHPMFRTLSVLSKFQVIAHELAHAAGLSAKSKWQHGLVYVFQVFPATSSLVGLIAGTFFGAPLQGMAFGLAVGSAVAGRVLWVGMRRASRAETTRLVGLQNRVAELEVLEEMYEDKSNLEVSPQALKALRDKVGESVKTKDVAYIQSVASWADRIGRDMGL